MTRKWLASFEIKNNLDLILTVPHCFLRDKNYYLLDFFLGEKAKARHNAKVIVPTEDSKKKTKGKSKNNTKKKTESKRSLKKSDAQPKEKLARGRKKGSIKKEENADLVEECDNKDPNAKTKSVKTTNKKGTGNRKRSIKKEATDVEVKDEKVTKIDDSHLRRSSRLKK